MSPVERPDDGQRRTRTLVVMGAPALAAFFAFWLPMFRSASPDNANEDLVVDDDTWTLLGLGLDPGDGSLQTAIRVLALLTLALLALCCYAAVAPPAGTRDWLAGTVPVTGCAALVTGVSLLLVTVANDGIGRFGTDTVQPVGASWLLVILPLWLVFAHDAVRRS